MKNVITVGTVESTRIVGTAKTAEPFGDPVGTVGALGTIVTWIPQELLGVWVP